MTSTGVRTLGVGAAIGALALLLSSCAILKQPNSYALPGSVATGSDGYRVTAYFENVENLVPNSRVLYNNVTIGTVTSIKLSSWQAKVTLALKKSVSLPDTVTLKVGQASLLGAEYVEVDAPPAGSQADPAPLGGGDTISLSRTGHYPETEEVLAAVSLVLNNGGLSQLKTITSELDAMIGAPSQQQSARSLISKANTFVNAVNENKQNVISLIGALNRLGGTLAAERNTVATAIQRIDPGLAALNDERAKLVDAVTALGRFGSVAASVLDTNRDVLASNLNNLEPVLTKLSSVGSSIGRALDVTGTSPTSMPRWI